MGMEGNQTSSGELAAEHTHVECYTPERHTMLLTEVTLINVL